MTTLQLTHANGRQVSGAVAACLAGGGVAAVPTETVYGLITRWDNAEGRERIYALKARDGRKPLQMLARGAAAADLGGEIVDDPRLGRLVGRFCPGALTLVVRTAAGTLGIRIPDCAFVLEIIRQLGQPLAATSANLSGCAPAMTADGAVAGLHGRPDLLVDGGEIGGDGASTVVSLLDEDIRLIRPGPVDFQAIRRALANGHT